MDAKRYAVVLALFILSMLTYIDRVCITSAKDPISATLHLSDSDMGVVFSLFALGYALAQVPAGRVADAMGPRNALAGIVCAWSILTALTASAWSFFSLGMIRFLFGIAEAGAFPGCARALRNWLPPGERGRANGALFSGSRLGAALSYPLLAWMLAKWHWTVAFEVLGVGGLVWAMIWFIWFRDFPQHSETEHEPAEEPAGQVRDFPKGKLILAMSQYFASNFTFFICLSWMLPYLKAHYHLSDMDAANYAMTPLLVGATSQWISGWMVDRLYRSRWRAWSRRACGMLGFVLAAASLSAVPLANSPGMAVLCFAAAIFGTDMTVSPSWVFCADIGGKNIGGVSGTMNMLGNIGSFVSANAFPYLQRVTGSASAYFLVAAFLNLVGCICWFNMRSIETPQNEVVQA
jgi:ACS family glucarate transporter-like MFS transporter